MGKISFLVSAGRYLLEQHKYKISRLFTNGGLQILKEFYEMMDEVKRIYSANAYEAAKLFYADRSLSWEYVPTKSYNVHDSSQAHFTKFLLRLFKMP